uniref:Epiplakin 1 n=1 Tax=Varanus komodoensis TaxID=61221 RepID=A0A8D2J2U9_VARKO
PGSPGGHRRPPAGIAGVAMLESNVCCSLYQALTDHLLMPGTAVMLLQAQAAMGCLVDPAENKRFTVEEATRAGVVGPELYEKLFVAERAVMGYKDPCSGETLSLFQAMKRGLVPRDPGIFLLDAQLATGGVIDPHAHHRLPVEVACRRGHLDRDTYHLLCSPTEEVRGFFDPNTKENLSYAELLQRCVTDPGTGLCLLPLSGERGGEHAFLDHGLRDKVTPAQLLSSEIINKDLFERLTQGGTLPKETLNLGKAQAATGHVIDPVANKKYSVDEALRAGIIGPDVYDKLVAAEKAVTGYRDPYTGDKISLFQAMMKDLIVKDHGIRLLEAQIATGGIIDPVNSHRLPVETAYKRGYFDKKMNLILSDPSDDTKGFFDPNTHENLTYLQLKEKCITEPSTGLCLLPLNSRKRQFIDDATKQVLRSSWLSVKYGRFQGQRVSLWDLLNSEYFSEGKRREILNHYCLRKLTLEEIRLMLEEESKKWARITFPVVRGKVTAYHLVESGIIEKGLFESLLEGAVSPEEVLRMESVRKYLYGTGSIGGILLQPSNERVSLYEAMRRHLVLPAVLLPLLEAQAATGFIVDPVHNQRLCLDDAVREGLVGPELYEKLQRAEEAVTGYRDPFTGKKVSLFQAMKKGLVADRQARRLMEAQLAVGGVMDPHSGHYVPVEFAQQKGYLDEPFHEMLSEPSGDSKVFDTLDSKQKVTYGQLMDQCQTDDASGIHLLPLPQAASLGCTDEQIKQLFSETFAEGGGASLWQLLNSGYFTEEQRRDFLQQYSSGAASPHQLLALVQGLIREVEMKAQTQVTFQGLRGAVPAVWLLDNGILSESTFSELAQGRRTAREVAEMEQVKKYLQGTGGVAGVFIQASKEKMGIYQAVQRGLLLPGTGARLLEAQAATGSITDPVTSQRLGVEAAMKAGLVGKELAEQLLQAERALTGYADPCSGKPISVCQAIRRELISASAGIPLLEAQLAMGGVIDPVHHLHLPLQAAYRHGFYDEEMCKILSQHNDDTCVFFDPNAQESVTYQQLKDRCIRDAETSLLLLPLSEDAVLYGDWQTIELLKSVTIRMDIGRYKGYEASLWDLLNSEYVSNRKRRELLTLYKEKNAELLQEMIATVTAIIEETEQQGKRFTFKGLRKQVSASDLFQSRLIDKETLDGLAEGRKTVQEVTKMDSVRHFLEGCNFIAGVLVQPSQEKMSIYQAWRQGLLRPGAALVLLEAQAATGFLIDPVENKKLSVEEALAAGLIGREIYKKLLSAEKAVTGYTHPYTKQQISLFEAMSQELIVRSHGIRLLEAQIATGGIIDPVGSHRIPVEVAYKRGYFDEKMNQILSDPSDDTKGFFDPNTHENLTYLQLLERCIQDPGTGLYMLQIVRRGERYHYIDEATKQFLKAQPVRLHVGRYKGQAVSMWDLLCSPYIPQHRRKDLVSRYKHEGLTLEQLQEAITTAIEETEQSARKFTLKGPRGNLPAAELFNAEIIDKETLDKLQTGAGAIQQLAQKDSVKQALEGTGGIAGILAGREGQKMTICEAMRRGLLPPEDALVLLEALAATGGIPDPMQKQTLPVDAVASKGLLGKEAHEKLLFAEKAATGYTDPSTGNRISLFQAMKKNLVEKEFALRLLEAQIATGGIIDPEYGYRIPVEVAYRRGYMDNDTFILLSDAEYTTKRFVDPNTQERITYAQLLQRCTKDTDTGMYFLPLLEKRGCFYKDEMTKNILSSTKVKVTLGKYRGQTVSLWELLSSDYLNEERKKELIKNYKQKSSAVLQRIMSEILNIIQEKEKNRKDIWFQGLRKQVTASELLKAGIIGKDTMKNLEEGKQTAEDVAKVDSVRRYLQGTGCIAGVLAPSKADPLKTEKLTIYQAMQKGILRPGTALELLEAQAATGFIADPLKNEKLSVDEAVSARLVGGELHKKLLFAEKAVTGYTDPNTGKKVSLFQAMKKELINKDYSGRLLEAQIATGGIIDPNNSHRLPLEVAYQRGFFDEEMSQKLSDQTESTKGFFDPNTKENLTYMQLLKRCIRDQDTGFLLLQIQDRGIRAHHLDETIKKALRTTRVCTGKSQGEAVPLWDLLLCSNMQEKKTQKILEEYTAGKRKIPEVIEVLTAIAEEKEKERSTEVTEKRDPITQRKHILEKKDNTEVTEKNTEYGLKEAKIEKATSGETAAVASPGFRDWKRASQSQPRKEGRPGKGTDGAGSTAREGAPAQTDGAAPSPRDGELESALRAVTVDVPVGDFQGSRCSVWELLFSRYVTADQRHELLESFRAGSLTPEDLVQRITTLIREMEEKSKQLKFAGLRRQVTASELFGSRIIDRDTLSELTHGTKTVGEVTEMESVKRYLEGTGCIAGVLAPSKADPLKTEKLTIYQAMLKGILRPGTALVLLEAQAATGFIADPLKNEKLSVDAAVSAGLVGAELQEKLLSAERAVTGYNDPYTGDRISLFQAMKKGLIVKDHGIRLLEAQIATGGIIDPVHSHRLPVEVAYQRGYFDEEMNQILSDPTDDTKGFFDPNTHENLTYMQLRHRCLPDPDSGLLMLHLMDRGCLSSQLNENARKSLQSARTRVGVGIFQGQEVSLWDLLFSRYVPPHKRQELLRQYKAGTVTREDITHILITIVTEAEESSGARSGHSTAPGSPAAPSPGDGAAPDESWQEPLKATTVDVPAGQLHGQTMAVWDLLFSDYISEEKRTEFLALYRGGLLSMERLISLLLALVTKKEATGRKLDVKVRSPDRGGASGGEAPAASSPGWESALRSQPMQVALPEFRDQQPSAWDLLFSQYVSEGQREELLGKLRNGRLTLAELTQVLATLLAEAAAREGRHPAEQALRSRMVTVAAGEFHGRKVSVWEVLHSKYIPEEKRKELLRLYRAGILTVDQIETVVTTIVNKTEEEKREGASHGHAHTGHWEDALRNHTVVLHIGEFRGQEVSLWDLLLSRYISDTKREELLCIFRDCQLTPEELAAIVSTLIREFTDSREECSPLDGKHSEEASAEREEAASSPEGPSREMELKSKLAMVSMGNFHGQQLSLWDLLHSPYISEEKGRKLLQAYEAGQLSIAQMKAVVPLSAMKSAGQEGSPSPAGHSPAVAEGPEAAPSPHYNLLQYTLQRRDAEAVIQDFRSQKASVWDPFFSRCVSNIRKQESLHEHGAPAVSVKESGSSFAPWGAERCPVETQNALKAERPDQTLPSRPEGGHGAAEGPEEECKGLLARQLQLKRSLCTTLVPVAVGEYKGQQVCVLDLLFSKYVPQDKRQELLELYRAGSLSIQEMITVITGMVEEFESQCGGSHPHRGRRRRASPASAPAEGLLPSETGAAGGVPLVQVREEPRWPFPTAAGLREDRIVAGIIKEPRQERLSIRQAMHRGLLTHGTGLALLEHQAVSGYIVDVAQNRLLSVRDAKNAGLVDREHFNTLLIAEKAVTGYTDPFSGNKISLFQAMKKGLIIKDHGIRLLEAQVATGGLIHPMHSHRLPVEVAYNWGYLDSEIFRLIADPAGHSKRCFDPNARENLTYLQLLPRCIFDPDTGLLMFQVADKGSVHLDENMRKCLKSATTRVHTGLFQPSHGATAWDLLFSRYVPRQKRQKLLKQFKTGRISLQDITQTLTSIVTEAEMGCRQEPPHAMPLPEAERDPCPARQAGAEAALRCRMIRGPSGQKVSLWDALYSKHIPKSERKELLALHEAGLLSADQMETAVVASAAKTQEAEEAKEPGPGATEGPEAGGRRDLQEAQMRRSLQAICIPVASGEFKGQNVSVLDLLHSKYFSQEKRQRLMELYRTGVLGPEQMRAAVSSALEKAEAGTRKFLVRVKSRKQGGSGSREPPGAPHCSPSQHADDLLRAQLITLPAGEFRGEQWSVWDVLFSQYLAQDKREELLRQYRSGRYSAQELASMLTILVSLHDLFCSLGQTGDEEEEEEEEDNKKDEVLKSRLVEVPVGEFRGRKVSVWDLLHSKYFPEKKRKEVLKLYRIGILTADQVETVVTAVVSKLAEEAAREGRHTALPASHGAAALRGAGSAGEPHGRPWVRATEVLTLEFPPGGSPGQHIPMWDLLLSAHVPESKRQDLLARYVTGALSSQEVVASLVTEAHRQSSTPQVLGLLYPERALFPVPGSSRPLRRAAVLPGTVQPRESRGQPTVCGSLQAWLGTLLPASRVPLEHPCLKPPRWGLSLQSLGGCRPPLGGLLPWGLMPGCWWPRAVCPTGPRDKHTKGGPVLPGGSATATGVPFLFIFSFPPKYKLAKWRTCN